VLRIFIEIRSVFLRS